MLERFLEREILFQAYSLDGLYSNSINYLLLVYCYENPFHVCRRAVPLQPYKLRCEREPLSAR